MRTNRMIRSPLGLVALGAMLALGCDDYTTEPGPVGDPGPRAVANGDLRVNVVMVGGRPDPDGFSVELSSNERGKIDSRAVAGQQDEEIWFIDLAPGPYALTVASLSPDCSVEGEHPFPVEIDELTTTSATLAVRCPRDDFAAAYVRQDGGDESFYLYPDSTFFLARPLHDLQDSYGTYRYVTASEILFSFVPGAPEWAATGTLHGDCMSVAYTWHMGFDGFENGEFCR